jgi:hypothetical protein
MTTLISSPGQQRWRSFRQFAARDEIDCVMDGAPSLPRRAAGFARSSRRSAR